MTDRVIIICMTLIAIAAVAAVVFIDEPTKPDYDTWKRGYIDRERSSGVPFDKAFKQDSAYFMTYCITK